MIYVITHEFPLSRFLFMGLDGVEAILIPIKRRPFLKRCFNYIARKMGGGIGSIDLSKAQIKKIKEMNSEDALVYLGESPTACYALSKICIKQVRKICFFWNSCVTIKNCDVCIKKIKEFGFSIASFDSEDAQRYNLIFANQFYRDVSEHKNESIKIENDFFFCGKNKGRKDFLLKLEHVLSSIGSCNFIIPERNDAMQYLDYIEELKRSRILCDVNQNGQSGLTLRVLESLFFQKKLITNNENIYNYDFFKESNILVINESISREKIEKFLSIPFEPYNVNVLKKYEVTNVLRSLTND